LSHQKTIPSIRVAIAIFRISWNTMQHGHLFDTIDLQDVIGAVVWSLSAFLAPIPSYQVTLFCSVLL
jgi:hypothetical protein